MITNNYPINNATPSFGAFLFLGNSDKVFQKDYFCPINYTTKEILLTDNTYAIHYFDASWFDKKLKASEKFLRALYKVVRGGIFTIFTRMYTNAVGQKIERYLKKKNKI